MKKIMIILMSFLIIVPNLVQCSVREFIEDYDRRVAKQCEKHAKQRRIPLQWLRDCGLSRRDPVIKNQKPVVTNDEKLETEDEKLERISRLIRISRSCALLGFVVVSGIIEYYRE